MKIATILFFLCSIGLAAFAYHQATLLKDRDEQVQKLNARLETVSRTMTLEVQEKCAKQARIEFDAENWKGHPFAGFTNHYNERLNKCFILVQDTSGETGRVTVSKTLFDAFEGKEYGSYIWLSEKGKPGPAVPPAYCKMTPPSVEKRDCHSEGEFDAFTVQFMQ